MTTVVIMIVVLKNLCQYDNKWSQAEGRAVERSGTLYERSRELTMGWLPRCDVIPGAAKVFSKTSDSSAGAASA